MQYTVDFDQEQNFLLKTEITYRYMSTSRSHDISFPGVAERRRKQIIIREHQLKGE